MRKTLNLTQKDIANKLEITTSAYNMIEKGKIVLTKKNKQLLIERLNINPEYFDDDTKPIIKPTPPKDELLEQLINIYNSINIESKLLLVKLAKTIKDNEN